MKKIVVVLLFLHISASASVDTQNIMKHIDAAARTLSPAEKNALAAAPPPPGGVIDPLRADRVKRLEEEQQAALALRATCDGRFNALRFDLKRVVTRSEKVSVLGSLFGVFGAVATCPHCAAIGAGLAGVANPLQQTFKDNDDAPASYQAKLTALSQNINDELNSYQKLPPADPDDPAFEKNLRARLDALLIATASCQYYEKAATPSTNEEKK